MSITYRVKLTRQAIEQMQEIVDYISKELLAPDAANNLLDEMEEKISSFAFMPKKNSLIDIEPWKTKGIRKSVVKKFLIYYWVDDENDIVHVVAVLYEKRNQIEQLNKLYK